MLRCLAAGSLLAASTAFAGVIDVPADAPTIQAAVDLAVDGDEIVIAAGVYSGDGNRGIVVGGRAITIRGANGAAGTTVVFDGTASGFIFAGGETSATRLADLTLTGISSSDPEDQIAAVLCVDGSPLVERCVFVGNEAIRDVQQIKGPAVRIGPAAAPTFRWCTFSGNDTPVFSESFDALFVSCRFTGNRASFGEEFHGAPADWAHGGAFFGSGRFDDCLFEANTATTDFEPTWHGHDMRGGAMFVRSAVIVRCMFRDNAATVFDDAGERWGLGGAIFAGGGTVAIDGCRFESNRTGPVAPAAGGAIAIPADESVSIRGTLLCGNFPDDVDGSYVDLGDNTFLVGCPCPGDLDASGDVGNTDLIAVLVAWGPCAACPEDFDGDGRVGFSDLFAVLVGWGPCS